MSDKTLCLRKATILDVDILFEWVNDKVTRQNAFDSHIITFEEHVAWFDRMMNDSNQAQYILELGDKAVGQIRLSIKNQEAEISYSILNSVRGCGYGGIIIDLIKKQAREDFPFIRKLVGKVKVSNVASYRCFVKNDFEETYRQLEFVFEDNDS